MSPFQEVLIALGGNAALLAVLGFLARSLVQTWLAKDIKTFEQGLQNAANSRLEHLKSELKSAGDVSIEQLKSRLQQAASEHQVRFAKLHEKRAQVIEDVYQRLVELEKSYGKFVIVDGYTTDPQKQQAARDGINQAMYDVALLIEKHRIYLPADVCASLKAFLDIMWHNAINVGVYGSISDPNPQTLQERLTAFREAYDALQKEIPDARAKLEDEFRKLLGDDSHGRVIIPSSSGLALDQAAGR